MSRRGGRARRVSRRRSSFAAIVTVVLVAGACATTLGREELAVEYYNIGSAYFDLGELEKSASYLSRALDLSPDLAGASYNLARVYVLQGRYERALELLDTLLSRDPDNALVMETIAYAWYLTGEFELAAEWYDRALDLSPTDPDLLQNRATVAQETGHHEVAVRLLRRALEVTENRPHLWRRLAAAERSLGRYDAALDAYRSYVDAVAVPDPEVLLDYAELLESEEYYAIALEVLGRLVERDEEDSGLLARAHFARGRVLLAHAREEDRGIDAIGAALRLGFADQEAAVDLLNVVPPDSVPALRAVLIDAGLIEPGDAILRDDDEASPEAEADPDVPRADE